MNTEATATGFVLTAEPSSKTKHKITLQINGTVVIVDTLNLSKASERKKFIAGAIEKFHGLDEDDLDSELLRLAARPTGDANPPTVPTVLAEVDIRRVVRPEMFHTSEVSGITIPVVQDGGSSLLQRWRTYLRWTDDRREVIDLPERITLADKATLYVRPDPGEPPESEPPRWSFRSRQMWLDGAPTPDPGQVFQRLCKQLVYYLDFPPETAPGTVATVAIWSILTYAYQAWDAVPYLSIGGPMNSGKSRLLEFIERVAFRPTSTSNTSGPCVFRTLHSRGGVLLYDEAETLRQSTPEVQEKLSIFLAGYKKGGKATRLEKVGDGFRPVEFQVYGPKALACIAGLPPTLASRCIEIIMFRTGADSEKPKRRLDEDPSKWANLRDDLHRLALGYGPQWVALANRRDVVPKKIASRNAELWGPILAIGAWLQDHGAEKLLDWLQAHALASVESTKDTSVPDADEILLELLAEAVRSTPHQLPTPKALLESARLKDEITFKKWSPQGVTGRLKNYGIPKAPKTNGVRRYRVTEAQLKLIGQRYGIDLGFSDAETPP